MLSVVSPVTFRPRVGLFAKEEAGSFFFSPSNFLTTREIPLTIGKLPRGPLYFLFIRRDTLMAWHCVSVKEGRGVFRLIKMQVGRVLSMVFNCFGFNKGFCLGRNVLFNLVVCVLICFKF